MKVFADTNFFTNVWTDLSDSAEAHALLGAMLKQKAHFPVTRLLRMEFTNALQRLVFETYRGTQVIRVSAEAALVARAQFDEDLKSGELLCWQALPEEDLEEAFDTLAYRHTAKEGFRTYDILHVASALLLGCDTFWSFDSKAKKLAGLEGLRTN
jgi:predicted nucleic acid-binding protein